MSAGSPGGAGAAWTPSRSPSFLDRIADDLTEVYAALGSSQRETQRIKDALKSWQSRLAREAQAARR